MSNSNGSNSTSKIFLVNNQVNKYTDSLYLYLIIPMASLGVVLNLLSFITLCKRSFNEINLFKYFRVYIFSSLIVSSSLIFIFFTAQYSFYELALSYSARIYACQISYVIALIFFYENALEIFINLERALCFSNHFRRFKKISPFIICLILLLVCLVVHSPNFFLFDIVQDYELPILLKSCKVTQFASSSLGILALTVSYVIEGPLVVLLVIISNLISLISFRRFIKRKAQLQAGTAQTSRRNATNERNENKDRKLLRMVLFMTSFSVVIHSVKVANEVIIYIYQLSPKIGAWFAFSTVFVWTLKNLVSNFFLYFGNTQFKEALNICQKQQQQQQTTQYQP